MLAKFKGDKQKNKILSKQVEKNYKFLTLATFIFTGEELGFADIKVEEDLLPRIRKEWSKWQRVQDNSRRLRIIRKLFGFILAAWHNTIYHQNYEAELKKEDWQLIETNGINKMLRSLSALKEGSSAGLLDLQKSMENVSVNLADFLVRIKEKLTRAEKDFSQEMKGAMVAELKNRLKESRINFLYENFSRELGNIFPETDIPILVQEEIKELLFKELLAEKLKEDRHLYGENFLLSDLKSPEQSRNLPAVRQLALETARILTNSLYKQEIASSKIEIMAEIISRSLDYSGYEEIADEIWQ